jgi:YfiH family protein
MAFEANGQFKYWTFDGFPDDCVGHGIFTRHGGISPEPWNSLNLGGTVGDRAENVAKNREAVFQSIHRPVESLYDVWQVHSSDVVCAGGPRQIKEPHVKADAIITNNPNITLFMRFADCVPILLYDPIHHAVGLVHAGWQGTVNFVVENAVRQMAVCFGSNPIDLFAGIGPSIGPDHYEIGNDVAEQVKYAYGDYSEEILPRINQRVHFDLWNANRRVLELSGVRNIEIAGICTACHGDDWYSHRAENGKTGRFAAVIFLKN